jgi:hypothetical protein
MEVLSSTIPAEIYLQPLEYNDIYNILKAQNEWKRKGFGGKARRKEILTKPRRRWVDIIKIDLRETGWDGMNWVDLAQDMDEWMALVNTVMKVRVP